MTVGACVVSERALIKDGITTCADLQLKIQTLKEADRLKDRSVFLKRTVLQLLAPPHVLIEKVLSACHAET